MQKRQANPREGNPQVRVPPDLIGTVKLLCALHEQGQITQRLMEQIAESRSIAEVQQLLTDS